MQLALHNHQLILA